MDSDIRNESTKTNTNMIGGILEYKPKYPALVSVNNEYVFTQYDGVKSRIEKTRQDTENRGTAHPYPWEDRTTNDLENKLPSSKEPDKTYVKKIYIVGSNISDSQTEETVEVSGFNETKPIEPSLTIRGTYGTFKSSRKSRNAPLIFILGGLTWPKTNTTESEIGNGPGQSKYPGDKINNVEGYMWTYGFKNLTDFNIYNCFTHQDGKDGWAECTKILNNNKIKPEKKILVLFSAGVNMAHSGLLDVAPITSWDIAHLIGGTSGALQKSKNFSTTLNSSTYYIQSKGLDVSSEGADSKDKKDFAKGLKSSDQVLTSNDHTDGIRVSSEWIKKNVKVTPPTLKSGQNQKRIIVKSGAAFRPGAKLKGGRTILYSSNSAVYLPPRKSLSFSPIANRAEAAKEIAKIKSDPGYKNWRRNIEGLCGGDQFLFRLYDLCIDMRCSFRDMMYVIAAECGFKPKAVNGNSGAAGLIQWLPKKWRGFGFPSGGPTTLTAIQQIPYIKKYYESRGNYHKFKAQYNTGIPNLIACYTFVAGGDTNDAFSNGLKRNKPIYRNTSGNPGWDYNGDNVAYAWEIADFALRRWYFGGDANEKRGVALPPGNSWRTDGQTIGMQIWDLKNRRYK